MKLINRNASNQLYLKIESLNKQHDSWRAIHLNLSAKRNSYSQQLVKHFFVNPIVDMLDEFDGGIYLCEDGDIVVLFQGQLMPVIDKFVAQFGDLNAEQHYEESRERLMTVYDLSIDYAVFLAICRHKLHDRDKDRAINAAYARYVSKPMPQIAQGQASAS